MDAEHVGQLTLEQLRSIIREEIQQLLQQEGISPTRLLAGDLSDFPVDDLGPWPEKLTLRREEMYDDNER